MTINQPSPLTEPLKKYFIAIMRFYMKLITKWTCS